MQAPVRVVTVLFAFSAFASANEHLSEPAVVRTIPSFESLDKNGDQRLSRSEAGFDDLLSSIFVNSDLDGNGFLTPEEYARAFGDAPVKL